MAAAPTHRLAGKLVTLFGGGGFVGRHAAQALMAAGARVRIVQRHPERAFDIRALGNLGQVQFVAADAARADAAMRAAAGSDAIVNLIAILKGDFDTANVRTAANIAAAAKAGGAAMVQVSAIGADAASASAYGRSKAAGEAAVRDACPDAIILRPSIVFGRQDQFINRFARLIRMAPIMPVVAPETKFQPVFVGDVGGAVAAALGDDAHRGTLFELGGPQILSMRALFEWIARQIGHAPVFIDVPDPVSGLLATATGWLPGAPITRDQWAMLGSDNVAVADVPGLAALGIAPTSLDAVAAGWLDIYRRHGRFADKVAN